MTVTQCPSLRDLGITPGSFIRKLNSQNHWNGNIDQDDINSSVQRVASKVFPESVKTYSLWEVNTDEDFYGVVASLTAFANPKDSNIDFICIDKDELEKAGIDIKQVSEGACLQARSLHYNAHIMTTDAQALCSILLAKNRRAYRCKKEYTVGIRANQRSLGCKAVDLLSQECNCQNI